MHIREEHLGELKKEWFATTHNIKNSTTWTPTMYLRFQYRNVRDKILQQLWVSDKDGKDWRDVPTVTNEE